MEKNEVVVKVQKDFRDKVSFKCSICGNDAEYLDKNHPGWYDFCREQNRNPNESEFAYRKTCDNDCKGVLELYEKASFTPSWMQALSKQGSSTFEWKGE